MQESPITLRGSGCVTNDGRHHFEDRDSYDWCRQCGVCEQKAVSVQAQAWRLASIEVEALACASCKRERRPTQHTTCERALRLAKKFRGRAVPAPELARGPETSGVKVEN